MPIQLSLMMITPTIAAELLSKNVNNRPIRKAIVNSYAKQMSQGRWKMTHQGIAFDDNGNLLDGQHRLHAIIQSGVSVLMTVASGVDPSSRIAMDDHARRTLSDSLTIERHEPITSIDIAIIRVVLENGTPKRDWSSRPSKQDIVDVIDRFRPAIAFSTTHRGTAQHVAGIAVSPVLGAIALAWFYVEDIDRLEQFCVFLFKPAQTHGPGDRSAILLREFLLRSKSRLAGQTRLEVFLKTQRCIVAFMRGEQLAKLYSGELYYQWPLTKEAVR